MSMFTRKHDTRSLSLKWQLALATLLASTTLAQAGELAPYAAESIEFGSIRGIAYYTPEQDGSRVIATLADGEAGLPVRFEVTLADRQSLTISVPGKLGEPGERLEISRAADKLVFSNAQPWPARLVATGTQDGGD